VHTDSGNNNRGRAFCVPGDSDNLANDLTICAHVTLSAYRQDRSFLYPQQWTDDALAWAKCQNLQFHRQARKNNKLLTAAAVLEFGTGGDLWVSCLKYKHTSTFVAAALGSGGSLSYEYPIKVLHSMDLFASYHAR
jgi:hypothetical protein